jgi:transposase
MKKKTIKSKSRKRDKRRRRKSAKQKYRVRNWNKYNAALVQRGSLTLWFDEEAIAKWKNEEKSGKRGRSNQYSQMAIECMAVLGEVYSLPLRATEGFVSSIMKMMKINLAVPDFSTLSRRKRKLEIVLPRRRKNEPIHLIVDATGLKVYGEGEWKVRQHGYLKRRTWRKLHIGIDEETGEIVAATATLSTISDKETLHDLLDQIEEPIDKVTGDGGYDYADDYEAIAGKGAQAVIPPRRNARIHKRDKRFAARNKNIRRIRAVGRKKWKKESLYHRRSLVETTMYRLKVIFGDRLRGRTFESQAVEMFIRCSILNRMTALGMPDSYAA